MLNLTFKGSTGPHVRVNVRIIVKWLIHYFLIIFRQLVIYHILPISKEIIIIIIIIVISQKHFCLQQT